LDNFTGLSSIGNTHNDTEGDDLWTAYHMYKRLNGIRQAAADAWYTRAQNLAGFFRDNYINGTAWNGDRSFNFDHLYGWGLCEWAASEGDSAAITTINQIVQEMETWIDGASWSGAKNPGDPLTGGTDGRRFGRQLRFAVAAYDASPIAANKVWRDRIIDIWLQAPNWDGNWGAYWLSDDFTDRAVGAGAYANGDRIIVSYHTGIVMDAHYRAWIALSAEGDSRASSMRQRLVDMATFYKDFPLGGDNLLSLYHGRNVNSGATVETGGLGSPSGVYTVPPVNGLVFGYKLTGDQNYLDKAWALWEVWQETRSGQANVIDHFVDSTIASATAFRFLANNKGELQYVYALFENGGAPTVVGTRPNPPGQLRVQ
jgi:hypothetical protein